MRGRGLLANLEASAGTALGDEWVDSDADAGRVKESPMVPTPVTYFQGPGFQDPERCYRRMCRVLSIFFRVL